MPNMYNTDRLSSLTWVVYGKKVPNKFYDMTPDMLANDGQ